MTTDLREGPSASVILSCGKCRHYRPNDDNEMSYSICAKTDDILWSRTPDWCPFHPGHLIAVPVSAMKDEADDDRDPNGEWEAGRASGYMEAVSSIKDAARALGQEILDAMDGGNAG